jgi:hypothetical protein
MGAERMQDEKVEIQQLRALAMHSLKVFLRSLFLVLLVSNVSFAEDRPAQSATNYVPSLGDMMAAIQLRHAKLFYAVKLKNWPLGDYELGQLNASLKEITRFYPNMPASDMTSTERLGVAIGDSIKAKSELKFDQAFTQMTMECNRCHEAAGRPFIYIRRPPLPSPYSNQMFAPRKR